MVKRWLGPWYMWSTHITVHRLASTWRVIFPHWYLQNIHGIFRCHLALRPKGKCTWSGPYVHLCSCFLYYSHHHRFCMCICDYGYRSNGILRFFTDVRWHIPDTLDDLEIKCGANLILIFIISIWLVVCLRTMTSSWATTRQIWWSPTNNAKARRNYICPPHEIDEREPSAPSE